MKFAVFMPNCHGDFADTRLVAQVAREAEDAGWDGFFLWDHIGDKWGDEVSDPWVMLAAIAMQTERIKLGTIVTPVTRRRPWKLAREVVTLDQLSNGRMILGVGSGGGVEYVNYHEPGNAKQHGEMLDEALDILIKLWSGERISYHGQYYQLDNVRHLPVPVQRPRIPIWIGGVWPKTKPMRRAAHWDGVAPIGAGIDVGETMPVEMLRACVEYIKAQRSDEQASLSFDVAHRGSLEGKDRGADAALVADYTQAGATWWLENIYWGRGSLQEQRAYIRKGPPHIG
jgi:alkanesulfonate monooxygenase SsuD/methylene tetrahydromethanopterin reductase-like flavin-dependent oxidoreductase (luciferase family)